MITTKTEREIEIMKEGGNILKETLSMIKGKVKPGAKTEDIDTSVYNFIKEHNAEPSFLGYHNFPKSTCISINEEVVHGIPGNRELREGDIVSVDIGVFYKGFHTDAAITLPVGNVTKEDHHLINTAKESLLNGLKKIKEGNKIGDIASAIQKTAEDKNYSVVRDCTGHGIGKNLHEEPSVPNFGKADDGPILRSGYTLAVEPMVNAGSSEVLTLEDGWTIVTKDRKKSAHFEFTVLVSKEGYENLTPIAI